MPQTRLVPKGRLIIYKPKETVDHLPTGANNPRTVKAQRADPAAAQATRSSGLGYRAQHHRALKARSKTFAFGSHFSRFALTCQRDRVTRLRRGKSPQCAK